MTGEPRTGMLDKLIPAWTRYPLAVYLASRLLFFLIAVVDSIVRHSTLHAEFSQWDGFWYLNTATNWYPHVVTTGVAQYSTLGFLPLYPGVMWLVAQVTTLGYFGSGLLVSMVLGVVATLAVSRLVLEWWGETPMRRAVVFWSLWPGTIVFSMIYSEACTITLVAGAFLLMARKRWILAGILAGAATAVAPIALAVIPACIAAALYEAYEHGWTTREQRRKLIAPFSMAILSVWGIAAFGVFLWRWTGTPLASYKIQHGAWSNSTSPLAIPRRFEQIFHDLANPAFPHILGPGLNLNNVVAVLGALFLLFGLWRLWKWRDTVPLPAIVYCVFGSLLVFTSGQTSPNPRMLLCLFPVLATIGVETTGRKRVLLLSVTVALTFVMSWLTFVGSWMLP
jgi:Glycosyltransferase family 87